MAVQWPTWAITGFLARRFDGCAKWLAGVAANIRILVFLDGRQLPSHVSLSFSGQRVLWVMLRAKSWYICGCNINHLFDFLFAFMRVCVCPSCLHYAIRAEISTTSHNIKPVSSGKHSECWNWWIALRGLRKKIKSCLLSKLQIGRANQIIRFGNS